MTNIKISGTAKEVREILDSLKERYGGELTLGELLDKFETEYLELC